MNFGFENFEAFFSTPFSDFESFIDEFMFSVLVCLIRILLQIWIRCSQKWENRTKITNEVKEQKELMTCQE